jgi:phosphatidylglycerol:prolipoprotein diacylglycerol transferase
MHPFLFQIGTFKLPTYGVISLCALGIAVLLVRRYARIEGLAAGPTAEAIVLTLAVGFFGARVFEAVINWDRYFGHPGGWKLLLHSTGVFLGGLITAIPFCIYWFGQIGLPVLQGLDILALTGCIAEGVGRWGCFFSGCCWGTPTDLPWAVTFPEAGRRLHPGLPDVPIHPTQIYMSLDSLAILGILLLVYRNKRFHGRIIALYVLLYATTRFFLEMVRGDAERGFAFGGRLSTSQLLGIVLAAGAAAAYAVLSRRHRLSGEPDWRPAKMVAVLLLALFVAGPAAAVHGGRKLVGPPPAMKTSGRTTRRNSRSVFRVRELRSRKPSLFKGFGELTVRRANKLAATVGV